MRVLIACEESGVVREAFRARGHDAWSCDLLPTRIPGQHIQGDVRDILSDGWDLMIAHPVCTFECNSGVRWLYNKDGSKNTNRWRELRKSTLFFKTLLDAPIEKICAENPVPHKYGIGKTYTMTFQPWEHGHGESKRTCLWLKNLPKLKPSNIIEGREARIHKMSPSKDRSRLRSETLLGVGKAMAQQWG